MNNHLQVSSVKRVGSQFHDTIAIVFPKGPKMSNLQEVVLRGLATNPTLSNDRLFVASQADSKISDVSGPLKFTPQDSRFDQVQVFYFLEESLNWFERRLNVKIPFKLNAEVHMGAPDKTNSAFYYQGKIRIGAGDDETYARIPQDPSIIIHESVHALVDTVARLPFEGEGGSLNEGFADFFTALQLDNPNMAEASYLKGPFRRSVVNNYKLSDKTGGLYHDSGIASGTLWELRVKLGPDKAREIAILTLNRLVPGSDFADFGLQLKEVLPQVLAQDELKMAQDIVAERGF
jgi:Zn-dependent metalloprotease